MFSLDLFRSVLDPVRHTDGENIHMFIVVRDSNTATIKPIAREVGPDQKEIDDMVITPFSHSIQEGPKRKNVIYHGLPTPVVPRVAIARIESKSPDEEVTDVGVHLFGFQPDIIPIFAFVATNHASVIASGKQFDHQEKESGENAVELTKGVVANGLVRSGEKDTIFDFHFFHVFSRVDELRLSHDLFDDTKEALGITIEGGRVFKDEVIQVVRFRDLFRHCCFFFRDCSREKKKGWISKMCVQKKKERFRVAFLFRFKKS